MRYSVLILLGFLAIGCSSKEKRAEEKMYKHNRVWSPIERRSDEKEYTFEEPEPLEREPYPWEKPSTDS